MGCSKSKLVKRHQGYEDSVDLAAETTFSVSEVEALYELFKKISSSIIDDGFIHKEEFQLALLQSSRKQSVFSDRVFDMFDLKRSGVIDFGEFVRALSVFHPSTSVKEKTEFSFKLYDLRGTGYIEREEVKMMVNELLVESDMRLSDEMLEAIIDKTFAEIDINKDDKIDIEEWTKFVSCNPSRIRIMTLPYLKDLTTTFQASFSAVKPRTSSLS